MASSDAVNDIDSTTGDFPWASLRAEATRGAHQDATARTRQEWVAAWLKHIHARHTFRPNGLDAWLAEADANLAYCLHHCCGAGDMMTPPGLAILHEEVLGKDHRNGHWDTWLPRHHRVYMDRLSSVHIEQLRHDCQRQFTFEEWIDVQARQYHCGVAPKWSASKDGLVRTLRAIRDYRGLAPSSWRQAVMALAQEVDQLEPSAAIERLERIVAHARGAKRKAETAAAPEGQAQMAKGDLVCEYVMV